MTAVITDTELFNQTKTLQLWNCEIARRSAAGFPSSTIDWQDHEEADDDIVDKDSDEIDDNHPQRKEW